MRHLRIGEAAKFLGVHEDTLRNWTRTGRIEHIRLPSGERRFAWHDLERVLARQGAGRQGEPNLAEGRPRA